MNYKIKFTKQAIKDFEKVKKSTLKKNALRILTVLEDTPLQPPYEKLKDNLSHCYSRRLNQQHRIVYEIREEEKTIVILRMWTHYEHM